MFKCSRDVLRAPISKSSKSQSTCLNAYKCEFCDKGWQSDTELFYHKRQHFEYVKKKIKQGEYFCWSCIRKYDTSEDLIYHYKMCHLLSSQDAVRVERKIFICEDCTQVFFNKQMLSVHIAHVHTKYKLNYQRFECPKCIKNVNPNYIWGHFHFHNMIGLHTCAICFTRCSNSNELQKHLTTHPPYLYCDMCGYTFDRMIPYTDHIGKHKQHPEIPENIESDEDDDIFSFDISKYFIPKDDKTRTIKYIKLQPYQGLTLPNNIKICVLCREICTSYKERKQHILQHKLGLTEQRINPIYEKQKYVCSCGEIFLHKILLKQHLLKNKGAEFLHEPLSESDVINLMSSPEEYAILEIVDSGPTFI